MLALLGGATIVVVSRLRVKGLNKTDSESLGARRTAKQYEFSLRYKNTKINITIHESIQIKLPKNI